MSLPKAKGPVARRQCSHAIVSVGHTPFNCHDHVKVQGNGVQLYGSACILIDCIHSQFGSLERSYEEAIALGSCTNQKSVILSKNEGEYTYQFCGIGQSN